MPLTASRTAGEAPTIDRNDSTRNILPCVPRRTRPSPGTGVGLTRAKPARSKAMAAPRPGLTQRLPMKPFKHWPLLRLAPLLQSDAVMISGNIRLATPHTAVHRVARRFLEPVQDFLVLAIGRRARHR